MSLKYYKKYRSPVGKLAFSLSLVAFTSVGVQAQEVDDEEEIFELSPFTVEGSKQDGYRATHTLAGTRIKTELKDVGAAISVVTKQFMDDIGAKDNETLLAYTLNTEVGGGRGNYGGFGNGSYLNEGGTFGNPNQNTRVRGLTSADNTRNYFRTDIPWDGYVVDRVDMVRGPNAVLFGLGSPAGVVNAGIQEADFEDSGEFELGLGSWGSTRMSMRLNRVLLEDELGVKIAFLKDDEKFRQDPAYDTDERLFVAWKYAPKFLQTESSNLNLQGHYESGQIRSNRPRWLPPGDKITPFFNSRLDADGNYSYEGGMDRTLIHPWGSRDGNGELTVGNATPFLGEALKNLRDEDGNEYPNPNWIPAIGNYGDVYGHPLMIFGDPNSSAVSRVFQMEVNTRYSINEDGELDTNTGVSIPFNRLNGIQAFPSYANSAQLPFYETGAHKATTLADRTIFDYRNHLIDGPNKWEESDFDTLYLSLSHTLLDGRIGYELSYFNQDRYQYTTSSVGNDINIDINSHLSDLSVNPNAGRAFTTSNYEWGTNYGDSLRDSFRATAFARHDFQSSGQEGWLPRLLGRHTATGLYAEENEERDSRGPVTYAILGDYRDYSNPEGVKRDSPSLRTAHYMGDPLHMRDSISGAYIPATKAVHLPPSQATVRTFDSHWNSPNVDPAAAWIVPWNGSESQQAYNPANYIGWVDMPMNIIEVTGSDVVDDWTRYAALSKAKVESEALVWQGHFWDGSVVGTYGWRKDTATAKSKQADPTYRQWPNGDWDTDGFVDLDPSTYNLDFESEPKTGQTQTASLAVHVNRLIDGALPMDVSLYYNTSENFQPIAGRVDMYGTILEPPNGSTEDISVLLATKDNKYSLKVTRYETSLSNASLSSGINTWFIGNLIRQGTEWAKIARYNLQGGWSAENVREDAPADRWWEDGGWNYHGPWVDDVDTGPAVEAAATEDWFRMIQEAPQGYLDAWNMVNIDDKMTKPDGWSPSGLTFTEDSISKGTEFEFVAQPTEQVRFTFNARKGTASRTNVGGEALSDFVSYVDKWFNETDAGEIRLWWLQDGAETMKQQYNSYFRRDYSLTKIFEGQSNPEMSKWSFNVVGTYSFRDGFLNGVYVGGGYRWIDKKVLGYPLKYVEENGVQVAVNDFDNAYYSDAEAAVDLWFGKTIKLTDNIDWRIQANVRDLFQDGDLIPLTVQPNGDIASSRIPGSTEWSLSNTFSF